MALYIDTTATGSVAQLRTAVAAFLARAGKHYMRYCTYRATLSELRALSARDLDDLGMRYTALKDIAWKAATRKVRI